MHAFRTLVARVALPVLTQPHTEADIAIAAFRPLASINGHVSLGLDPTRRDILRVEVTCACLWPLVRDFSR
jgi:hypothetical protein